MAKDYYKDLGVEKNASADDIKNAFRRLAFEHHPDKGGKTEKFKEINEAYQVLSDSNKRAQYDRFGTAEPQQGFGGGYGGGFGGQGQGFNINLDDLGDIFGGFGDIFGGGGRQRERDSRGHDIQVDAKINFNDSVFGTEYEFSLNKSVRCSNCQGTGGEPNSKSKTCATCHGSGQVSRQQRTVFGVIQSAVSCSDCRGEGKAYDQKCNICHGSGVSREVRKLKIKIPAGITDGATIRVSGEGEAGERNHPAGDLFVRVRVKADPRFRRVGDDIHSDLEISYPLAALGGSITAETIDGPVDLKIPAGVQPGNMIKLRGAGVPELHHRENRGDHLFTVVIKVPKKLSKKAKQLLEELKEIE